jgi:tetratricopeptide (TPR) repeat protein
MKSTNYHEHGDTPETRKRFWLPLLVALPVVGILLSVPIGLRFLNGEVGLDTPYRYQFSRPPSGSTTLALGKEMAFYQERIRQNPEDGLDRASLAGTYLKKARATGDASWYLLAEQTAQQSLAKLPFHNDGAILALAQVAQARHDFAEAIRLAEKASGKEDALSIMVTAKLATGKVEEASVAADSLVNLTPTLGALTLQGLVKVAQGKDDAALQSFQQALAAEEPGETGGSIRTRTLLGRFYFKRGELKKARALYKESLRVLPQYPPALLNLAELEVRQGNYKAAEGYYSKFFLASKSSPTIYDHVALRGMARVKELSGDQPGAKLWHDKAEARLRQEATAFGHRRELARLLLRGSSKDVAEALTLMQMEVRVRRDAETLGTLAEALSRSGRWPEARTAIQEALRSGIRDPGLFHQAGVIEQALLNQSQSLVFFRLAQETDPTFNEQAQQAFGLGVGLLGMN